MVSFFEVEQFSNYRENGPYGVVLKWYKKTMILYNKAVWSFASFTLID